jgi:glycoprotein endo-alpha-1,2-mannosidase
MFCLSLDIRRARYEIMKYDSGGRMTMTRNIIFLLMMTLMSSCGDGDKEKSIKRIVTPPMSARSYDIHIFYHPGFGTPEIDGEYRGWNSDGENRMGEPVSYPGNMDIASSFFPAYGCYSSNNPKVIESHMGQLAVAQTGVACVMWYGKDSFESRPVQMILDTALRYSIRVDFMIAAYEGRTIESIAGDIRHIIDTWGKHEAFYITDRFGMRPMFFIEQAWSFDKEDWALIFGETGTATIRNTPFDAIIIAGWQNKGDGSRILDAGFDGFYTPYTNAGTWGADIANWEEMNLFAMENNLIFIPTIRPGYDDTRLHSWNGGSVIERDTGAYYMTMVKAVMSIKPPFISVDSFNDWQAGTQIEPSAPMKLQKFEYRNYHDANGYRYLRTTKEWVKGFSR